MAKKKDGSLQEKIIAGTFFFIALILVIIGFGFISSTGDLGDVIFKVFVIYSVLNLILPLMTLIDKFIGITWFKSLLFNPDGSLIHQLHLRNKSDPVLGFLDRVNSNIILSLLFWTAFFAIPMFFAQLFAPQSAIGTFVSQYVFPVRPQSIFDVLNKDLFFTIYPAMSETGALVALISFINSIIDFFIVRVLGSLVSLWISLILVGFLLSGIFWRWIHTSVSAGREFDVVGHTLFGVYSGVLTIGTGQWTAAFALHLMNLFFWFLRDKLAGNEFLRTGLFYVFIFVFVGVVMLTVVFSRRKK